MFRILSLDGGGIKGTFTAAVLAELEALLDRPLADYFDLVIGTSTGGIIGLGMGLGFEAQRILELYKENADIIFPQSVRGKILSWIFSAKYDPEELRKALAKVFGRRRLGDIDQHRVAVTSFNAVSGCPVVFKSPYHPSLRSHLDVEVVDIALATSAAPTYFPAAELEAGVMIDGGVWANCPVMVGITEAMSLFKQHRRDISVLSIGTTSTPFFVEEPVCSGGLLHWANPVPLMMHAAKLGVLEQAKRLCRRLVRLDREVSPDRFDLDGADGVEDLDDLGRDVARKHYQDVKRYFLRHPASKNEMMHSDLLMGAGI